MRYLLPALTTLGILISASLYASEDQDYAKYLRILRGNYRGLVEDIAVVKLTCDNRVRILDEVAEAFETYATAEDLGFSQEEFERALAKFVQRHCDKIAIRRGPHLRPSIFHEQNTMYVRLY